MIWANVVKSRGQGDDICAVGRDGGFRPVESICLFKYRKNKNSEKISACAKEHPVWILLLRANMFSAQAL